MVKIYQFNIEQLKVIYLALSLLENDFKDTDDEEKSILNDLMSELNQLHELDNIKIIIDENKQNCKNQ